MLSQPRGPPPPKPGILAHNTEFANRGKPSGKLANSSGAEHQMSQLSGDCLQIDSSTVKVGAGYLQHEWAAMTAGSPTPTAGRGRLLICWECRAAPGNPPQHATPVRPGLAASGSPRGRSRSSGPAHHTCT